MEEVAIDEVGKVGRGGMEELSRMRPFTSILEISLRSKLSRVDGRTVGMMAGARKGARFGSMGDTGTLRCFMIREFMSLRDGRVFL